MISLNIRGKEINFTEVEGFRKWDAADELLLNEEIEGNTLVINDTNGAITCALDGEVYSYTASFVNKENINETLLNNKVDRSVITDVKSFPERVDNVILKLPKSIDLLEYYIDIVATKYKGANFIATGMVKYMPISMTRLVEEYFTDVTTSLAKKKARLIFGKIDNINNRENRFPIEYVLDEKLQDRGKSKIENKFSIMSYPGVFSYKNLDLGTRFLIRHIPKASAGTIIDLGCGSGILGLIAKYRNPEADVYLTDESSLAVDSAKMTFEKNELEGNFVVGDKLGGFNKDFANLIICNPPFHQDSKVLTDTAMKMFKEAKKVLKPGGRFLVVANRHLGYHKHLRAIFHNMKIIDKNEKFNVYSSYKPL